MIRLAKISDIPEIIRMGEAFFNASGYDEITTFNAKDTESLVRKLIRDDLLLTDGKSTILGFVVFPVFMNSKTLVAQELFWWVDEDNRGSGIGVEILMETEKLAKKHGAKSMLMLSLNDLNGEKVNKLYESMGYKRQEQTFMRVL